MLIGNAALLDGGVSHRRPALDAVASMLYLDYRAPLATGYRTIWWEGKSRGDRVPSAPQRDGVPGAPRDVVTRGRVDIVADGVAPVLRGRPGVRAEVEHGVDARHAAVMSKDPSIGSSTTAGHVQPALCVHGELRPAVLARRGRARQGVDARQDAGRHVADVRQPAPALWLHVRPSGKKLLFMGSEFGQGDEWDRDSSLSGTSWTTPPAGLAVAGEGPQRLYREEPALHGLDFEATGFKWIDCHDNSQSVLSFLRKDGAGRVFAVLLNFTPVPRVGYRIGVPEAVRWRELLNSDSGDYGGSNLGNLGVLESAARPWDGSRPLAAGHVAAAGRHRPALGGQRSAPGVRRAARGAGRARLARRAVAGDEPTVDASGTAAARPAAHPGSYPRVACRVPRPIGRTS